MIGTPKIEAKILEHQDHFENLFAQDADPWNVRTRHGERHKRWVTNAALGAGKLAAGLEIGCANGISTRALAPRFLHLMAIDGSASAVDLARDEVRAFPHVTVQNRSLPCDFPHHAFDAVVANEVLYYLPLPAVIKTLQKIHSGLKPGGRVVSLNHWRCFHDTECSAANLMRAFQVVFGAPIRIVVGAGWRGQVHVKRGGKSYSLSQQKRAARMGRP
jgi:SAM-dependent methyltransferase